MGKTHCSKHGVGGITLVCPHIRRSVDNGEGCPPHHIVGADLFDDVELLTKLFLCHVCTSEFGLNPNVVTADVPDELEPLCAKCLFDSINKVDKA